jgi:membrane-associated phospholipid phosphatase
MKKFFTILVLSSVITSSANAFFFNGTYEYTTYRGHEVGRTAAFIGEVGDWLQILIPISAAVYSTAIGDWEGNKQLALSVGSTWATTEMLKSAVGEERPNAPEGSVGRTFPSGHTSFAFSGAAYWQRRYGWEIGVPMYAAATYVAYSRVRVKMHNWLDVATGAALGIGFNYLFTDRYENTSISVSPTSGGAYVSFSTKF